jgi:outer membrane protein assembly factor BamD
MSRRIPVMLLLGLLLAFTAACTNKKVQNPLANVSSKQPDKVLFDRAMDAMKHNRFEVARMSLQTLINTYPDSEYLSRAKLSLADSWYAEGGAASLTQAEIQYKDFITFFPNVPEAAEAQFKIANIHYQQMEKADRDYTHAMRAEDEYRQMILQFPDSKLVPEAKERLLEVQEILAEREFEIGRFYYLRPSYPAAIARLKSVVDKYPLYSQADQALYLLGQSYEGEVTALRAHKMDETAKARMIEDFTNRAAEAYSHIITRYPLMDAADPARKRLEALQKPVPKPTKAEVAQNRKEEESRHTSTMATQVMGTFKRHPDVSAAAKVGNPTLVDPTPVSATEVVQQAARAMVGAPPADSNKVSVETVGSTGPGPNEPIPRSDAPPPAQAPPVDPASAPPAPTSTAAEANPAGATPAGATPAGGELTPNVQPDANELKPNVSSDNAPAPPPPAQVNEIQNGGAQNSAESSSKEGNEPADPEDISSSKKKKKSGIHKVVPF